MVQYRISVPDAQNTATPLLSGTFVQEHTINVASCVRSLRRSVTPHFRGLNHGKRLADILFTWLATAISRLVERCGSI